MNLITDNNGIIIYASVNPFSAKSVLRHIKTIKKAQMIMFSLISFFILVVFIIGIIQGKLGSRLNRTYANK